MGGRLRPLTATEVETILSRFGFVLVGQKGSHRKWRHLERRLQVIVPWHAGRTLPAGTLVGIMRGAEIPEHLWRV